MLVCFFVFLDFCFFVFWGFLFFLVLFVFFLFFLVVGCGTLFSGFWMFAFEKAKKMWRFKKKNLAFGFLVCFEAFEICPPHPTKTKDLRP